MNFRLKYIRWTARVLSLIVGGGFILILIITGIDSYLEGNQKPMESNAILQLTISVAGCLSMMMAWKWELTGGIISVLCFVALGMINPETFPLITSIFMLPGVLFIITSVLNKIEDRKGHPVH